MKEWKRSTNRSASSINVAKVFTKMKTDLKNKIGSPDLLILFTSTVSHKMVHCAVAEAERKNIIVERSHSSSASALNGILEQYA